MVHYCCIASCGNNRKKNSDLSFFRFPYRDRKLLYKWVCITMISRDAVLRKKELRICSQHFHSSDFMYGGTSKLKKNAIPTIFQWPLANQASGSAEMEGNIAKNIPLSMEVEGNKENVDPSSVVATTSKDSTRFTTIKENTSQHVEPNEIIVKLQHRIEVLEAEVDYLQGENKMLKDCTITTAVFAIDRFQHSDLKIRYYTGLHSFEVFAVLFQFMVPSGNLKDINSDLNVDERFRSPKAKTQTLSPMNQMFLTLCRLRRGYEYETLGDLFNVSKATAGKICLTWINFMYVRLGQLTIWPHRDVLLENAPVASQRHYKNVVGSIDCTEFAIETPSSLVEQSQCFSHYKGCTTLKSLIMTDPNGSIIYMSPLFTGSISDKNIIEQSGFIDILKRKVSTQMLLAGDIILADKGFNVESLFNTCNIELNIPTFRITGRQFSDAEVAWIRNIAHERIHVERDIARLKAFRILSKRKIPVALLGSMEQIYAVCCMLTSFRPKLRSNCVQEKDVPNQITNILGS